MLCSIPRYELLLRELIRFSPPDHPERARLEEAFSKIQAIASHINEEKRNVGLCCFPLGVCVPVILVASNSAAIDCQDCHFRPPIC